MSALWVLSLVCLLRLQWAEARDFTFTYQLGAGKKECFYDYIHTGALLEIEYRVRTKCTFCYAVL